MIKTPKLYRPAISAAAVFACSLTAVVIAPTTPLAAQAGSGNEIVADCMTRTNQDGTQVSILVPQQNRQAMREEGYEPVKCSDAIGGMAQQRKWRDEICTIAATSSEAVQSAFERQMGARPATLCGMAEQIVGSWGQ